MEDKKSSTYKLRNMGRQLTIAILAITVVALLHSTAAQQTHVVGDKFGWLVPPGGAYAYEAWAETQTFAVGDILVFNFTNGDQDVARVTKEAFKTCNSTNPLTLKTTSPANFTLDTIGEYYFIGTKDKRCELGQKLAINVTAEHGSPTPSPAPKPSPAPRGAVTYVVGDHFGWIVPPGGELAYATWAYGKTFYVGDTLEFNFTTGEQDVARVTKEAFESCNITNATVQTAGPAYFKLETVGQYYFIGTKDKRCELGQKLAINVTANPGPNPSPSVPAPAPTPRGPVTYTVGDKLGWIVPGSGYAYATWAYGKTFIVGDTLVFNFANDTQDVAVVTKSAYENCTTNNTIAVYSKSPVSILLNTSGEHFFTSTYDRHCVLGQKLAINNRGKKNRARENRGDLTFKNTKAMAKNSNMAFFVAMAALALVMNSVGAANTYEVGDALGWVVAPPGTYSTWASNKTFTVGDVLVFKFSTGNHDVAEVAKANYDSCSATSPISLETKGPANLTLSTSGEHYYICTFGGHCAGGQKLSINVTGTSSPAPAPAPSTSSPPPSPSPPAAVPAPAPSTSSPPPPPPTVPAPGPSTGTTPGSGASPPSGNPSSPTTPSSPTPEGSASPPPPPPSAATSLRTAQRYMGWRA
ncbi:early nodulin-like protein 14 [Prunus dulcis]|uniref:Early nodulin-like protein 14 n=1 Tax=Prunus dulcis TaxID=3755 RepID=A0A5H2Y3V9_PRUDU|nr:early nodulin-like protein 14 [Prunus dulcis]